jgi:hypothetical protein
MYSVSTGRARIDAFSELSGLSGLSDTTRATQRPHGYAVFGPVGTVADISYFYVNADPQRVDAARLPWSMALTASVPAVMQPVMQRCGAGDSNSIGCPIVVDGQVEAERISHEVNGYPHCLVQGA